ncbi:MAG: ribonuclease P protein component [Planctomycetes bacterium]|nr:ribonuclease P protein component [Planctomycetota bacterium]
MKSGAQFSRAYRRGGRAKGSIMQVVAFEHGEEHTRLGLSVGKRVWRSAVKRNRVRRVFREAFRLEYDALPKGCDLVLIPAASALQPELAATRAELVKLASKAHARFTKRSTREEPSA